MKIKKIKQMSQKEKELLAKIIDSAEIAIFDSDEVKKKLGKALIDLLDSIEVLLYGEQDNDNPRPTKRSKRKAK